MNMLIPLALALYAFIVLVAAAALVWRGFERTASALEDADQCHWSACQESRDIESDYRTQSIDAF